MIEALAALDHGTDDANLAALLAPREAQREADRDALTQALRDFDEAAIFTIHGFCQHALRECAFESSAPFELELAQDQGPLLREVALDYFASVAYGADPELVAALLARPRQAGRSGAARGEGRARPGHAGAAERGRGAAAVARAVPVGARARGQALGRGSHGDPRTCSAMPRLHRGKYSEAEIRTSWAPEIDRLATLEPHELPEFLSKLGQTQARRRDQQGGRAAPPLVLRGGREAVRGGGRDQGRARPAGARAAPRARRATRARSRRGGAASARRTASTTCCTRSHGALTAALRRGAGAAHRRAPPGGADRRVPGHRPGAVRDLPAHLRRERRAAVPDRRPEAGDLRLPRRRRVRVPERRARVRRGRLHARRELPLRPAAACRRSPALFGRARRPFLLDEIRFEPVQPEPRARERLPARGRRAASCCSSRATRARRRRRSARAGATATARGARSCPS